MTVRLATFLLSLIPQLLGACASPTETELSVDVELALAAGERIVLFADARSGATSGNSFSDCVTASLLERGLPEDAILDTQSFQDALFPWFEPAHAPQDVAAFESLLARPKIRAATTALRVRYLLAMALRNESDGTPGMLCGGGYAGAGCLGLAHSDDTTELDAVIWDMASGQESGTITAKTSGSSLALGLIIPLVFVAYTEAEACQAVAGALGDALIKE